MVCTTPGQFHTRRAFHTSVQAIMVGMSVAGSCVVAGERMSRLGTYPFIMEVVLGAISAL